MPLRPTHLAIALLFVQVLPAQSQPDAATQTAIAAMQSGDLVSAETTLQTDLRQHPRDPIALEVLAAVLDQEKKYPEAAPIYQRALAVAPHSPSLLNNYGNHLLATGKPAEAQAAFTKVLSIDPAHPNANLQLARFAIDRKDFTQAARFLRRFTPATIPSAPQAFALGLASSAAGQHARAAAFFARTLELQPDNFDALYDLGLAASHAGDYARAQTTLQKALDRQPANVDLLCDLAAVDLQLNKTGPALELLVHARQLAPDRPSVALLLARATSQLGDFADAVQAWDAYLKLNPGPNPETDIARRERAFAQTAIGHDLPTALEVLRSYAANHPDDATGQYEFGAAESPTDPAPALQALTRAITLKPDFAAARLARGLLLYRQNQPDRALADFTAAAKLEPHNPTILRRLGQTYTAINRPADALRVLRTAESLAPQDPAVLLQLARALSQSGRDQEAAPLFTRYRQLTAGRPQNASPSGLLDFLNLSPDEQRARYRAGVERTVAAAPTNAEAQVRHLGLLLDDGKLDDARSVSRKITALQPDAPIIEDAVAQLLAAGQYAAATEMLQSAHARGLASPQLELDTTIPAALTFLENGDAAQALRLLDKAIPQFPRDPRLRLMHALATTLAGHDATTEFHEIETRWPEWSTAWVAHALVLQSQGKPEAARRSLATAATLGDTSPIQNIPLLAAIPFLFPSNPR